MLKSLMALSETNLRAYHFLPYRESSMDRSWRVRVAGGTTEAAKSRGEQRGGGAFASLLSIATHQRLSPVPKRAGI